jgi:hypothetical protein
MLKYVVVLAKEVLVQFIFIEQCMNLREDLMEEMEGEVVISF